MNATYKTLLANKDPPNEKSQYSEVVDGAYKIGGANFWNYEDDLIEWVVKDKPNTSDLNWFQPIYDDVFKFYLYERLKKTENNKQANQQIRTGFLNHYSHAKRNNLLTTEAIGILDAAAVTSISNMEFINIMMGLSWESRVIIGI